MVKEERSDVLVDDDPETVVVIPDAAEPIAPRTATADSTRTSLDRRGLIWIGTAVGVIIAILAIAALRPGPDEAPANADPVGLRAVAPTQPIWASLAVPVPDDVRTHTLNIDGSADLLALATGGPGAVSIYDGTSVIADGPTVSEIFGEHAFSVTSTYGATMVAYLPYSAGDALILEAGQKVTFVGTLHPVPEDFAAMVGTSASAVADQTAAYVAVVPLTLRLASEPTGSA